MQSWRVPIKFFGQRDRHGYHDSGKFRVGLGVEGGLGGVHVVLGRHLSRVWQDAKTRVVCI